MVSLNTALLNQYIYDAQRPEEQRIYQTIALKVRGIHGKLSPKERKVILIKREDCCLKKIKFFFACLFGWYSRKAVRPFHEEQTEFVRLDKCQSYGKKIEGAIQERSGEKPDRAFVASEIQHFMNKGTVDDAVNRYDRVVALKTEPKTADEAFKAFVLKEKNIDVNTVQVTLQQETAQLPVKFEEGAHLDEFERLTEQATILVQNAQYEKLATRLKKEFDEKTALEIVANPALLPELASLATVTDERIEEIVGRAKTYFANATILSDLYGLLEKRGNQEIAETVLDGLAYRYPEIFTGTSALSQEIVQQTLQQASELKCQNLIDDIAKACGLWLPANLAAIRKQFPIDSVLDELPPESKKKKREKLLQIININFLKQRMMKKTTIHRVFGDEAALVKALGYSEKEYKSYDKDHRMEIVAAYVQSQLGKVANITMAALKKNWLHFLKCERLKTAGIDDPTKVAKFKHLEEFIKAQRNIFREALGECVLPDGIPVANCPLAVQFAKTDLQYIHYKAIDKIIFTFIESQREAFNDKNISESDFRELLKNFVANSEEVIFEDSKEFKKWQTEMVFLQTWGPYIVQEMMQGYSAEGTQLHEVLGGGICWAITNRLCMESQKHPTFSIEQLGVNHITHEDHLHITKEDRLMQAKYSYQFRTRIGDQLLDEESLKKRGFQEERVLIDISHIDYPNLITALRKNLVNSQERGVLEKSHGWVTIGFSGENGHQIALRADFSKNRFWLFDPNVGILAVENERDEPIVSFNNLLNCFEDLMKVHYSKTKKIAIIQKL